MPTPPGAGPSPGAILGAWYTPLWFYSAISLGFVFILVSREHFLTEIGYAVVLLLAGVAIYMWRARRRREWPFRAAVAS